MKIYTRRGDTGDTSLFGGQRVRKSSLRVEAYGTVDELNCQLGVARAHTDDGELRELIGQLQGELFTVGADLATPPGTSAAARRVRRVTQEDVQRLEEIIDRLEGELPPLRSFVLPGGHPAAAHLHLARSICRAAERRTFRALEAGEEITDALPAYLNRLSDLLFVLARSVNMRAGIPDPPWNPSNRQEPGQP